MQIGQLASGLFRSFCARLHLGSLAPAPGSKPARKRVGRGGGRFCGRGAAGQNSRSGRGLPKGFAGGQTPLHIATPKFGFVNPHKKEYSLINLDRIQMLIDSGRIDSTKPITVEALYKAGIENLQDGVKILARGGSFFSSKVFIQATKFTKEAIARIEELGGAAVAVHHTELGLRSLTRPEWFKKKGRLLPRVAAPVRYEDRLYYSDPARRGYLVAEQWEKCAKADPSFESRYMRTSPVPIPEAPLRFKDFLSAQEQDSVK